MNQRQTSYFERNLRRRLFAALSSFALVAAGLGVAACESDDDAPAATPGAGGAPGASGGPAAGGAAGAGGGAAAGQGGGASDEYAGCERDAIEADLNDGDPEGPPSIVTPTAPRWRGPAVDPATGTLRPGDYVFSSTYLAVRAEGWQRFGELMGPISADLQSRPGLLAITLASSESCGSARTLTAWESEEAMYAFVASEAHGAAVSAVGEVSRGGSIVTHWSGDEADATWVRAADALRSDEGPFYLVAVGAAARGPAGRRTRRGGRSPPRRRRGRLSDRPPAGARSTRPRPGR